MNSQKTIIWRIVAIITVLFMGIAAVSCNKDNADEFEDSDNIIVGRWKGVRIEEFDENKGDFIDVENYNLSYFSISNKGRILIASDPEFKKLISEGTWGQTGDKLEIKYKPAYIETATMLTAIYTISFPNNDSMLLVLDSPNGKNRYTYNRMK